MINKDVLTKYVRIISGCDADPNLTLVDFSLSDEQRNVINLVNEEAKKDKDLANLLEDLKYSNNKNSVIEDYFNNSEISDSSEPVIGGRNSNREKVDNYGFVNLSVLSLVIGIVVLTLGIVISIGS